MPGMPDDDEALRQRYEARLGLLPEETHMEASSTLLEILAKRHCAAIPFENLDQHPHEAGVSADGRQWQAVAAKWEEDPSSILADPRRSVTKIVDGRGGFCYELNPAFGWYLEQRGFLVRYMPAEVYSGDKFREQSTHLVILVKSLLDPEERLVDVGFGDPPRGAIPVTATSAEAAYEDDLGDRYWLERRLPLMHERSISDHILHRIRKFPSHPRDLGESGIELAPVSSPAYRFALDPNTTGCQPPLTDHFFTDGLTAVLTTSPLFCQKKVVCVCIPTGHVTLCHDRVQWIREGSVVKEIMVENSAAWRQALHRNFNMVLQ